MLRIIVPTAVSCELKGLRDTSAAVERPQLRASFMFSQAQTMAFSQSAAMAEAGAERDESVDLKSEKLRTGESTKKA